MEEVAKVVDESGLRGSLSQGLIGIFDGDKRLASNVELYKNCHGSANGRVTIMFGPHAIYTCPPDYLKKVAAQAQKLGAEIHMHMNETRDEINDCLKNYGKRPFEVVNETGLFDTGTLAAHCVWLSDAEIEIIKAKKIRVAHNPGSNMKLASGIAAFAASLCLQFNNLQGGSPDTTEKIDYSLAVSTSSKLGLRMTMAVIPVAGLFVALFIFWKKYILTDEKISEISKELEVGKSKA